MDQRQIERRRARARAGGFQIANLLGEPVHSRFEVRSPSGSVYHVEIRDPTSWNNGCTCPDFQTNLLGTCKHVEAVLQRLQRDLRGPERALLHEPSPRPWVYVAWGPVVEVRLVRPRELAAPLAERLRAFFDAAGRLRGEPVETFRRLEAAAQRDALPVLVSDEARRLVAGLEERRRAERDRAALDAALAEGRERFDVLQLPLYPFQVRGALHLALGGRAVLADEMGLGKTAQALAACAWLARTAGLARVLVVCPASVKHQWVAEARRFLDQPTVAVIEGPRARREEAWRGDAFLTVVNYELLRQDVDLATGAPARFGLVVLDEAQRIKDWRARTSEAVKRLGRAVPRAFVLTGTPLSNDLDELYSVMQFVDPRVLGPLWSFNERYFAFDASGRVLGYRHLDEVRRKIAPVLLRRTREEVQLELPEVVESTRLIEMTREQRALHAERAAVVARLVETLRGRPLLPPERERLLGALATMRMACDSLFVLDRRTKTAPKLDELVAILREVAIAGGRKVLVFSEWERMTALAAARLDAERIGYVRLHGGVPSGQRGALVERFTQDPACRVFLSTDAGGVGLNLQAASVVVHLDLPWSPARLDQRLGRALRIGQRATVQVVRLVAQGTIEERLLDTLARKRALLDAVIAGDGPDEIAFREPREAEAALLEGLVSGGGVPEPSPPEEPAAAAPVAPEPSAPKPPAAREDLRDRAREKAEVAAFLLTGGFLREAVLRAAEAAAEDVRAALSGTEAPPDGPALLAQAWAAARAGALDGAALERWRLLRDLAAIVGAGEPLDPGLAREAVEALAEGARADARARPDFAAPPDAR